LGGSKVTDDGMKTVVAVLPKLEDLHLAGSPLTDAGLKQLHSLGSLTQIYLAGTKISDAGLMEFKKALPRCRIIR
jgi:hypothetical protein